MKHWFDYVRASYDIVLEAESKSIPLEHEVEAYAVHLLARNFERTDIGTAPVAIQLMEAMRLHSRDKFRGVGDECLLIHSWPLRQMRWPTATYYSDMGMLSYGYATLDLMERNFYQVSEVFRVLFNGLVQPKEWKN